MLQAVLVRNSKAIYHMNQGYPRNARAVMPLLARLAALSRFGQNDRQ
jgi:hypothetical protein